MNIYQIKNQEGKFLNIDSDKPYYTSISWRASYLRSEKLAKEVIRLSGVSGLEVFETTESAYTEELAHSTTSIAIQMDSLQLKLSNVAYHLPTMSGVNKSLKLIKQVSAIRGAPKTAAPLKAAETPGITSTSNCINICLCNRLSSCCKTRY